MSLPPPPTPSHYLRFFSFFYFYFFLLKPFSFLIVVAIRLRLADCLNDVAVYGFAKVEDVPNNNKQVLDLAAIVGYVRETNYGE